MVKVTNGGQLVVWKLSFWPAVVALMFRKEIYVSKAIAKAKSPTETVQYYTASAWSNIFQHYTLSEDIAQSTCFECGLCCVYISIPIV